jgi:hypothetical protein
MRHLPRLHPANKKAGRVYLRLSHAGRTSKLYRSYMNNNFSAASRQAQFRPHQFNGKSPFTRKIIFMA